MKLTKGLQHCVKFSKFCNEHQIDPVDLAELLTLIKCRINAVRNESSYQVDPKIEEKARKKVEEKMSSIKTLRLNGWPGNLPDITTLNGWHVILPLE